MSTTVFPGVRIVDMPDLGAVTDTSSVVGEHAGSGRFGAAAFRSYSNMVTATGSTVPRSNADRWSTIANVLDYGAIGDGVATSIPPRSRPPSPPASGFTCRAPPWPTARHQRDQLHERMARSSRAAAKGVSIIAVGNDFNLGALGVFVMPGGPWVPGPRFRDFQISVRPA